MKKKKKDAYLLTVDELERGIIVTDTPYAKLAESTAFKKQILEAVKEELLLSLGDEVKMNDDFVLQPDYKAGGTLHFLEDGEEEGRTIEYSLMPITVY